MTTAVIGLGNIGKIVARLLANGNEELIVASRDLAQATSFAKELGPRAMATSVTDAISRADNVILTVWFDVMKDLIAANQEKLKGKVVFDPSNPIKPENGKYPRTLPDGVSSGSIIADLLPQGAYFVKAFGTLGAESLAISGNRKPTSAVLFYAADDQVADNAAERLITAAGYEPVKVGGVNSALRIEVYGDLHQFGGLNGEVPDGNSAHLAIQAKA